MSTGMSTGMTPEELDEARSDAIGMLVGVLRDAPGGAAVMICMVPPDGSKKLAVARLQIVGMSLHDAAAYTNTDALLGSLIRGVVHVMDALTEMQQHLHEHR